MGTPNHRKSHAAQPEFQPLMNMSVSVIVPVFKGGEQFEKCFYALKGCSPPCSEIIVVVDGETDHRYGMVVDHGETLVILDHNSGPAAARNCGARKAKGDILLFMDADVVVKKDIIGRVIEVFSNESDIAALIGSYDNEPGETNFISQYRNLLHHYVHQTSKPEAVTFWGACGAIRKEVFSAVGGFDETFRKPSIEDIEFGYRLGRSGYRIKLQKDIQVTHLKKWTFFSMVKTDVLLRAIPWSELMLREKWDVNDLNVSTNARLSALCVLVQCIALLSVPAAPGNSQVALSAIILSAIPLLILNNGFYRFLMKARGPSFLLLSLPFHWLYFFYSGLSFVVVKSLFSVTVLKNHVKGRSPDHP